MPKRRQPCELALREAERLSLLVRLRGRGPQAPVHVGEARRFGGLAIHRVLRCLALFLGAREIGRETRQLLVTGFPQAAQLEEHERTEAGIGSREKFAERIQLLLNPDGRAFLLLETVAQQMEFVLEVRMGLLQARAILEELHEPLFVSGHAAVGTSLEKTQLVDQLPAFGPSGQGDHTVFKPLEVMPPLGTVFQPLI